MRVADAHSDLLLELAYRASLERPFERLWLDQLRAGGVRLQVCAIWTNPRYGPDAALRVGLKQALACHRAVAETEGVRLVTDRRDLEGQRPDEIGLVLAMEGCEPLGGDPAMAEVFWRLGVRMFSLTWMRGNAFASGDGDAPDRGLSGLGRSLLTVLDDLGAMIDLAHASPSTFWEVLEGGNPDRVLISHAGCRALADVPRNVDDRQLRAIAEVGGLTGLMAHPLAFGKPTARLSDLVEQVLHAVSVAGPRHVGVGGDFAKQLAASGAFESPPEELTLPNGIRLDGAIQGFEGPADYPALATALEHAGLERATVSAVIGENLTSFMERALPAA